MNGHTKGFPPQTQKLEPPQKTSSFTLAVKGFKREINFVAVIFFIPKVAKCRFSTKFPNFILQKNQYNLVLCERATGDVSFEWLHYRILSTESKSPRSTLLPLLGTKIEEPLLAGHSQSETVNCGMIK